VNKNFKKIIGTLCMTVAILGVASYGYAKTSAKNNENLPITKICASYAINVNNLEELIGDADYVFVGEALKNDGVEYKKPVVVETELGSKEYKSPYTNYSLKVVENIKGNLVSNIEISKVGGTSSDKKTIFVYEGDVLPVEGKTYIFSAYGQPDGTLLVSGANSNQELNLQTKISRESLYSKYKEALENQIVRDRERFESIYEE